MVRSHFPGKPRGRHRKLTCVSPLCDSSNEASLVAENVYHGLTAFNSTFGLDNEQIPSFHGFSPHQVSQAKKSSEECQKEVEKEFQARGVIYVPFLPREKYIHHYQTMNFESRTEMDDPKCFLDEKENADKLNCDDNSCDSYMSSHVSNSFDWSCKSQKKILEENPTCLENIDVKTCQDLPSRPSRCKLNVPNSKKFVLPCRSTHSSRVIKPNKRFLELEANVGETSSYSSPSDVSNSRSSPSSNFVPLKKPKLILNENSGRDSCWKLNVTKSNDNSANNVTTPTSIAPKPPLRKGILREAILNIDIPPVNNMGRKSLSEGKNVQNPHHSFSSLPYVIPAPINLFQDNKAKTGGTKVGNKTRSTQKSKARTSTSRQSKELDTAATNSQCNSRSRVKGKRSDSFPETSEDGSSDISESSSQPSNSNSQKSGSSGLKGMSVADRKSNINDAAVSLDSAYTNGPTLARTLQDLGKQQQEVVDSHAISVNFWENYDPEEVCKSGFALIGSESIPVQALCFLCGSAGVDQLIHCVSCCEAYHQYCVEMNMHPSKLPSDHNWWRIDWVCPKCTFCPNCNDPAPQLRCQHCQKSYHTNCVSPNYQRPQSTDRKWVCPSCLRCKSCNQTNVSKFIGNLPLCLVCFKLRKKGNFCPLCQRCYEDDDYDSKMMECARCKCWVHAKCEGLSHEKYQVLSHLPESVEYICRVCCDVPPAPWWLAVEEELRTGYSNVLQRLSKNKKACEILKWSPKKQKADCICQKNGRIRTLRFPDSFASRLKSVNNGESKFRNSERSGPMVNRTDVEVDKFKTNNNVMHSESISFADVKNGESPIWKRERLFWEDQFLNNNKMESLDENLEKISSTNKESNFEERYLENGECFCSGLETWTKAAPSLLSIKKKVNGNEYSSLIEFHEDVEKGIGDIIESEDLKKVYNLALKEVFPWFDSQDFKVSESPSKHDLIKDDSSAPETSDITSNKIEGSIEIPDSILSCQKDDYYLGKKETDTRICILCKGLSEGPLFKEGRLLYCGFNDWIHSNCALWSSEVFEEIDGSLQNVHCAISRGKMIRCSKCAKKGATIGCCSKNCTETFHFPCAKEANCTFYENKTICCQFHSFKSSEAQVIKTKEEFHISRPMYVELDRRKKKLIDCRSVKLVVGSLHIYCLGIFNPLVSDTPKAILPVEFHCSRLFWSSVEPWKLVPYYFKTNLVDPTQDYDDKPNLNFTVDHSVVVESLEDINLAACEVLSSLCDYVSLEDEEDEEVEEEEFAEENEAQSNINDLLSEQETVFEDLPNEFFDGVFKDLSFKLMSIEDLVAAGAKEDSNESKVDGPNCIQKKALSPKASGFDFLPSDKSSAPLQSEPASDVTFQFGLSCDSAPCQDFEHIENDDAFLHIKIQENCNVLSSGPCTRSALPGTNFSSFQLLQVDGVNDDDSSCSDSCSSIGESEFSASEDNQSFICSLIANPYCSEESSCGSKIPQLDGTVETTDDGESVENPVKCNRCHRTYRTATSYKRHLNSCSSELIYSSGESDSENADDNALSSISNLSSETPCPELNDLSVTVGTEDNVVQPQSNLNLFCVSNEKQTIGNEPVSVSSSEFFNCPPIENTESKSSSSTSSSIAVDFNQASFNQSVQSMNELLASTSASPLPSVHIDNNQFSRSSHQFNANNSEGQSTMVKDFCSLTNMTQEPSVSIDNSLCNGFVDHLNTVNGKGRPVVTNGFCPPTNVNKLQTLPVQNYTYSGSGIKCVNAVNGKGRPVKTYSNKTYGNKKQSKQIASQPVHLTSLLSQQVIDQQKLSKTIVSTPMYIVQQMPLTTINTSPFIQHVNPAPAVQYFLNLDSSNFSQPTPALNSINPSVYQVHQSPLISSLVPQVVGTITQPPPPDQIVFVNPQVSNTEYYPTLNVFHSNYENSQPTVMCLNGGTVVNNSIRNNATVINTPLCNPTPNNTFINKTVVNCPLSNNTVLLSNLSVGSNHDRAVSFTTQSIQEAAVPTADAMNCIIVNSSRINESHQKSLPAQQLLESSQMTAQSASACNWSINKHSCKTTKEVTTTYYAANTGVLSHDEQGLNQVNCVKIVQKEMTKEMTIKTATPSLNNAFYNQVSSEADVGLCQSIDRAPNSTTSLTNIPSLSDVNGLLTSVVDSNHSNVAYSEEKIESCNDSPPIASSFPPYNLKTTASVSNNSGSNLPHQSKEPIKFKSSSSVLKSTAELNVSLDENLNHFKRSDSPPYSLTDVFSTNLKYLRCYPSKKSIPKQPTGDVRRSLTSKPDYIPSKLIASTCKFAVPGKKIACDDAVDSRILKPANTIENIKHNTTLDLNKKETCRKPEAPIKNIKKCNKPKVIFEINSEDGFSYSTTSLADAWKKIFETVQQARLARNLPPLPQNPFKNAEASLRSLGLDNNGLKYLLEQLPGVGQCANYKPSYHKPKQPARKEDLFKENKTGCARSEPLSTGKGKYDMFSWLASRHRRPPKLIVATEADLVNGNRRATSLNLPMAMRFRHLKETSKEAVGVFRSDIHGRGLFCLRDIDAGEMVIEYAGEVIRPSLTDKRENYYDSKGIGCYMFRIDDYNVVDATLKGNAARFINHSCEPNCYSRIVDILGKKHILIFAQHRILQGEELTYDYKFPLEEDKISCHCLSRKCRKYLN